MSNNIHDLFSRWGRSQCETPVNDAALKAEMLKRSDRLIKTSGLTAKTGTPWLSIAFAAIAVIMLIIKLPTDNYVGAPVSVVPQAEPGNRGESVNLGKSILDGVAITDTREFSKIGYHAEIKTRNVNDMATRVQTIVHGFDGRIDSSSVTQKNGYLSFVVPAKQFDAFRSQIQGLVGDRFIIETTSSQNLLPQKQYLENQYEEITKQIRDLKSSRSQLIASHQRLVASLQEQIDASIDEQEKAQLRIQLANENTAYSRKLGAYNVDIKNYETNLNHVKKEDRNLVDNVATVNGTISIQWMSVWKVLDFYLGSYWLVILFALAAIGAYIHNRQQMVWPID